MTALRFSGTFVGYSWDSDPRRCPKPDTAAGLQQLNLLCEEAAREGDRHTTHVDFWAPGYRSGSVRMNSDAMQGLGLPPYDLLFDTLTPDAEKQLRQNVINKGKFIIATYGAGSEVADAHLKERLRAENIAFDYEAASHITDSNSMAIEGMALRLDRQA